jgi:hypothetical protein
MTQEEIRKLGSILSGKDRDRLEELGVISLSNIMDIVVQPAEDEIRVPDPNSQLFFSMSGETARKILALGV